MFYEFRFMKPFDVKTLKWLGKSRLLLQRPSSPSLCQRPSHGTSSPHWVPTHAGRIMDGDWNTYKAEFTAAPQAELGYISSFFPQPTKYFVSKQQNKSHIKQPVTTPDTVAFLCVKHTVGETTDRSLVTSIITNDDERAS